MYVPCTTCLHILVAHPCLLLFIKSTVYCPAHFILLHILFFFILIFLFYLYLCIFSCVVLQIIALSIEWTWPDFIVCIIEYVTNKTLTLESLWSVTSGLCIDNIPEVAKTKVSKPKRYSLSKLRLCRPNVHAKKEGMVSVTVVVLMQSCQGDAVCF